MRWARIFSNRLRIVIAAISLPTVLGSASAASAESGVPTVKNITTHFETIFYPEETKHFLLRVESPVEGKRYAVTYRVEDFWGETIDQGELPISGLYWGRLTTTLPEGRIGWFRVHLTLRERGGAESTISESTLDFAVVPRPDRETTADDAFFGIADTFNSVGASPDVSELTVHAVERLGARWLRLFGGWESMQDAVGGAIDWSRMDRAMDATSRADIRLLVMLGFSPEAVVDPEVERPMHRGQELRSRSMPPLSGEWKRFVGEAAERYQGRIGAWEIWNEPNASSFWPGGDADSYAQLYVDAYEEIRAKDPDARIVMGGLSGVKPGWIRRFANEEVAPRLTTLNVHPYRYPSAPPEGSDSSVIDGYGRHPLVDDLAFLQRVEADLPPARDGQSRQIWITEAGYNTMPGEERPLHATIPEADQAALLVRTMMLARASGVDRFFWWRLFDTYGAGMGLLRNQDENFEPKPAYVAYAVLARQFATVEETKQIGGLPEDVFAVRGVRANGTTTVVLWSVSERTAQIKLPDGIEAVDLMGGALDRAESGIIELSAVPIYLESTSEVEDSVLTHAIQFRE